MTDKIPVSVVVVTKNEARNLPRCLAALQDFEEIIVVNSGKDEAARAVALQYGASFKVFEWNGTYPKKRQWCLDHLPLRHTYVFFVDADEEVAKELAEEISALPLDAAGYFVDGLYVMNGKILRHGLRNRKLCLIDKTRMSFPVVDDLDIEGMGEIEGHYQPVLKSGGKIESLKHPVLHHAFEGGEGWGARHERYARWESAMISRGAYPQDPSWLRENIKRLFRVLPFRAGAVFFLGYILKAGCLDGREGLHLARAKAGYYARIARMRQ